MSIRGLIQSKILKPRTARKIPSGPYNNAARKPGQNVSGSVIETSPVIVGCRLSRAPAEADGSPHAAQYSKSKNYVTPQRLINTSHTPPAITATTSATSNSPRQMLRPLGALVDRALPARAEVPGVPEE